MGGHYIFAKTSGLAAVGSTKIGSMLRFQYFYWPLGPNQRRSLGESFKYWFSNQPLGSTKTGYANYYRDWFYGMTLLGDPTLTIDPPIANIDSIVITGQTVYCNGNGTMHSGSVTGYQWRSDKDGILSNESSFAATDLSSGSHAIYFSVKDSLGRWSNEAKKVIIINGSYGDISGNGEITAYDAHLSNNDPSADVSGDGIANAYDAALIAKKSVGLIDKFPVEQ